MIIGAKNNFAIEYRLTTDRLGFIRLWIKGLSIGLWEETFVFPVILSLGRIKDYTPFCELDIEVFDVDKIFKFIMDNEEDFGDTILGLGETFDSYILRGYQYRNHVVFIWKTIKSGGNTDTPGADFACINVEYFINIISKTKSKMTS